MLLDRARDPAALYHLFHIFPLRVFKQVLCMFVSANPPSFALTHGLDSFVINRDWKYLNPNVRVEAFLTRSPKYRQVGVTGMMRLRRSRFSSAEVMVFSEIALAPLGFVLTTDASSIDSRLVDISHFARCGYNEWRDVALRLPVLDIYSVLPGDYRTREEVVRGISRN